MFADLGWADYVLSNGVGPVVVVLLIIGALPWKLWTDAAYQAQVQRAADAEVRAARSESKVDEMVRLFIDEVTPALTRNTDAVGRATLMIERLTEDR